MSKPRISRGRPSSRGLMTRLQRMPSREAEAVRFQRIAARSAAVARDLAARAQHELRIFGGYSPVLQGAIDHQRHAAEFAERARSVLA